MTCASRQLARRRPGIALLGLCLILPAFYLASGRHGWNLRLEPWLSWTWELPGPLPYLVALLYPAAVLLLLPEIRAAWRGRGAILVGAGLGLLVVTGLLTGTHVAYGVFLECRIVHLPDPGVFDRAVVEARGARDLGADLWVVRHGGGRFEQVSEADYPPCDWPFTVRKSPDGARYLFVDARLRASALLDLTRDPPSFREHPSLAELRSEFGEDIQAVTEGCD